MRRALIPLLILVVIAATALAPQAAYADLTTSLQAYWKFDESSGNPVDSSGNSNTFTNTNTATFNTGLVNNAAYTAGASSQYFTRADTASLSVTGDFTLAVWIYLPSSPVQGNRYVVANKEGSYLLTIDRNKTVDGAIESWGVQFNTTGINAGMIGGGYAVSGSAGEYLSLNTWHLLAVTRVQSSGQMALYLDGTQTRTDVISAGTAITDNANAYEMARGVSVFTNNGYYTDQYFNGRLDETAIYSRALTSGEVTSLYNAGAGCQYSFAACTAVNTPARTSIQGGTIDVEAAMSI